LATATIAMPVMTISVAIAMLVGNGGNALCALRLGEGKRDEAEAVVGNTFALTIIMGILMTLLLFVFMDPILALSGATEETWASSHIFLSIVGAAMLFQYFGMGFNNFIRTAGDPNRALYTMVAGTIVCIVFNWLFVMVMGLGVMGSALATALGQGVSAALVFWYFVGSKKAPFKIRLPKIRIRRRLTLSILSLGSASFVLQVSASVVVFILNNLLVTYGAQHMIGSEGALAGLGVVQRVSWFIFFPILGVAVAAQPIIGFNYGASQYDRVKETFKISLIWVIAIGLFFWVLVHLIPGQIVGLFNVRDNLRDFTTTALRVQLFMTPVLGLQALASHYFQSSGQPLKSMLLSLTRQLLYLLPLIFVLPRILPLLFSFITPLDSLYFSIPIADLLSVTTAAILMAIEMRKLNRYIKEQHVQHA
jgi:putative MATE family efflux protein